MLYSAAYRSLGVLHVKMLSPPKIQEEPSHTIKELGMQKDQEFVTRDNDEQPVDKETWITQAALAEEPPTSFDEFNDTSFDFSAFVLNHLKIPNLTQKILGPKCKTFYRYASNLTSSKDVYSRRRIIAVTRLTFMTKYDKDHLEEIEVRRDDHQLYTFKEGDFKRLRLQDIEDMLLLLVQQKLTNLTIDERYDLNLALRMFISCIVIQKRVKDLQLDQFKRKRLMRTDEFLKFSDGTLNDVRCENKNGISANAEMDQNWRDLPREIPLDSVEVLRSILMDSKVTPTKHGRMTKPYLSPRFIANCFNAGYLKIEVKREKVTAIEELKDLTSLSFDELIGNLKVHEMIIKKDFEIVKAKVERKSLALKAKKESSDEECSTFGSEDEEYIMAVRDFKKSFKRRGRFVREPWNDKKKFQKSQDDKNDKSDRKYFRCGDPNHLIRECPKPPKDKNQRAFVGGSWSDSSEEDDEKVNNKTCLVAQASSEVCSESSYFSDENSLIDELILESEYDKLCKMSLKIITKNKRLKATRDSLEKEISILKEKMSTLEKKQGS
nr:zf-CCHC domain-containing protein/UBN2 domain-containing protein [Tanacetum cinerariifolium]